MKLYYVFVFVVFTIIIQSCNKKTDVENIKTVAVNFYKTVDEIGAGKTDINTFDNIVAPNFKAHLPDGNVVDKEGFKAIVQAFKTGFPGASHNIENVIAEDNSAAVRMIWQGTHKGIFQNIPASGNTIRMSEMGILKIENGKVTEFYPLYDSMTFMQGLTAEKK